MFEYNEDTRVLSEYVIGELESVESEEPEWTDPKEWGDSCT